MDEPIEELYFNWLYDKVASIDVPSTPSLTYLTLLRELHATEFVWLVSHDSNRAEDGIEVRKEFIRESYLDEDPAWNSVPCSVLEMLIAFSYRAAFETEISSRDWFWKFLENLGIDDLSDNVLGVSQLVDEALDEFIWRTYEANGDGGLFPLSEPEHHQRQVEVWYQFCEWLVDHDVS